MEGPISGPDINDAVRLSRIRWLRSGSWNLVGKMKWKTKQESSGRKRTVMIAWQLSTTSKNRRDWSGRCARCSVSWKKGKKVNVPRLTVWQTQACIINLVHSTESALPVGEEEGEDCLYDIGAKENERRELFGWPFSGTNQPQSRGVERFSAR